MPPAPPITLTTDFGLRDTYVAQMKGVIAEICPLAPVIDLCHEVPPQDVPCGAFLLETGCDAFPAGTIHVAVVDPGVGTPRRAVVLRTARHLFVAPDNGLLDRVLEREPAHEAYVMESIAYRRATGATTFDGRDLFAPAAAWLASGVAPSAFGPPALPWSRPPARRRIVGGEAPRVPVVHVDRFGNAIVDVRAAELRDWLGGELADGRLAVVTGGRTVARLRTAYAGGVAEQPFLLVGSSGYLELALDRGDAARALGLAPGVEVELRRLDPGHSVE